MKLRTLIIIIVAILLILAGAAYWYFFLNGPGVISSGTNGNGQTTGFSPFGGTPSSGAQTGTTSGGTNGQSGSGSGIVKIPTLRLLSSTPIGGYGASTTASTTIVRWVDRGRGNIYEADEDSLSIATLANTLLPRVYQSVWDGADTDFVGSIFAADDSSSAIYASLVSQASTASSTNSTPYLLHGKNLPAGIVSYAVSPKGDQVFLFAIQNGQGIGYVSPFDGGTITQIFDTPVTQVNVAWPEQNTIAITTKGSATTEGYLYFVNPKTGIWKKVIGPVLGLSAVVSHDARYVLASATGNSGSILTSIYSVATSSAIDAVIRTLADKCAWGNFYEDIVYCAVPSQPVDGTYPDDWYKGDVSFVDKIWQVNAVTGEIHLVSSIIDQSDRVIDAFNLGLDKKDDYLFFMNKNDLSFWSLNLVASQ